jgi:proline iminopeptidase
MEITEDEGFVNVLGYKLYYRNFRPPNSKGVVLCLHGGPGVPHEYILSMADLAKFGYTVIFYDQLGVGKSEVPKNKRLFIVERYVEELEELRKTLNLGKIHLWGSSWGGILGIAYAMKYQQNLKSLISAGGGSSVPLVYEGMLKLRSELPGDVQQVLAKYENESDYENPEYLKAMDYLYRKHVCRLQNWPPEVKYAFEHVSQPVYNTMWGPNEFTLIGNIMYWDVTSRLGSIKVPTLITFGRFDEATPEVGEAIHDGINGSKVVIFENSSHLTFWEEREKYMGVVVDFLDQYN